MRHRGLDTRAIKRLPGVLPIRPAFIDEVIFVAERFCPIDPLVLVVELRSSDRHPLPGGTSRNDPVGASEGGIWRRTGINCEVLGGFGQVRRAEEHVDRDVHEHRSRTAAERRTHALGSGAVRVLGRGQSQRFLGQAAHDLDMVHLLQRAHPPTRHRRPPADDEHRAVIGLRLGERRRGVGHTGPRRHRHHTAFARDLRPTLGRKRRRLLMADVDHSNPVLGRAHEERPDVAAIEREEVTDAGSLEGQRNQLASVARVHA